MKKLTLWLGALLALCMNALAATPADYCSKPIRLAMFEYGVLYNSRKGDGIDSRLLALLAKRSGCHFEQSHADVRLQAALQRLAQAVADLDLAA